MADLQLQKARQTGENGAPNRLKAVKLLKRDRTARLVVDMPGMTNFTTMCINRSIDCKH